MYVDSQSRPDPDILPSRSDFLFNIFNCCLLFVFLFISLFPGHALALSNTSEQSHKEVVFLRDSTLIDEAILSVNLLNGNPYTSAINKDSFVVRSSLVEGAIIRVVAAAYSSSENQTDSFPNITASGHHVENGIIAANFVPLGTKVKVNGQKFVVLDRMNSRYDDKYVIDIWMPSAHQARQHGIQVMELEIIELP